MTPETKQEFNDRFMREMTDTIEDMLSVGVIDDVKYKLTMRELNRSKPNETVFPLSSVEIKNLRKNANMSQSVFARYLHLTVDHISKLERGKKHPKGPALVLLNIIRRKGIEAIL